MFFNSIIILLNRYTILLFGFIYKYLKIESIEDKFHKHKKEDNLMNKVKFEFNKHDEFIIVKNNILDMIKNDNFLQKYDITTDSILNNSNNKLTVSFKDNSIYIYFNHYYISGPTMFVLLNKMVNSNPPNFLQTNPFMGILYLPFYIYDLMLLKKKEYLKIEKKEHLIIEKILIQQIKGPIYI